MISLHQCTFLMALLAAVSTTEAGVPKRTNSMPYLREEDLSKYVSSSSSSTKKNDGKSQWMSISEDVQFMPNSNLPPLPRPPKNRKLETEEEDEESTTGAWEEYDPYSVQPFVEGMSEYDEYQQAWRLLGFMIDCNSVDDDDGSGSGSEDVTEDGCARYVLWAAVSCGYSAVIALVDDRCHYYGVVIFFCLFVFHFF